MAEEIKVPAGVYDMVTRCMEQEFPDNVAIRYVGPSAGTTPTRMWWWKSTSGSMRRTSAG